MSRDVHIWKALKAGCILLFIVTSLYGQDALETEKFGWIKINTDLDSAYVVIDDKFYDPHLITSKGDVDSIKTRTGPRKVTIVWWNIDDIVRRTFVYKDTTRQLNIEIESTGQSPKTSFYTIQRQYNLEISGAEDADIYLNGKLVGRRRFGC